MWSRTGSRRAALAPLASGFLVDVDHFVDYALMRTARGGEKIVLPLHGWEWVPVWWAIDRALGLRGGAVLGYLLHLTIDQLSNDKRSHLGYFVAYRIRERFRADLLGPVNPEKRHKWREASPAGLLRWL